jgi:CMP/dCMP kinase
MIVTVSGLHGTGKSTYAAQLAKGLKLRHVSAGVLFRRIAKDRRVSLEDFGNSALEDPTIDRLIDEETMKEAEMGDVVIDGQLAGWVLKEKSDLRIYLTAPDDVRLARIARRDGLELDEAKRQTAQRERVQLERYRRHYGLNVEDKSIYHLVLDTSILSIDETAKVLLMTASGVRSRMMEGVQASLKLRSGRASRVLRGRK